MTRQFDAWVGGIDLILSTHDRLTVPRYPESVRGDVGTRMRDGYLEGFAHVGPFGQPAQRPLGSISTEEHLLVGAFLAGVSCRSADRNGRAEDKESAIIGCGAGKHLAHALLRINAWQRETFFRQTMPRRYQGLQRTLVGSLSEAHVAAAFIAAGHVVLVSTTEEDVDLSVDLLVPFHDPTRGLAIQVKTTRGQRGVVLHRLNASTMAPDTMQEEMRSNVVSKVNRFNWNLGVSYEPVIAFAGADGNPRFSFEPDEGAQDISAFVREIDGGSTRTLGP